MLLVEHEGPARPKGVSKALSVSRAGRNSTKTCAPRRFCFKSRRRAGRVLNHSAHAQTTATPPPYAERKHTGDNLYPLRLLGMDVQYTPSLGNATSPRKHSSRSSSPFVPRAVLGNLTRALPLSSSMVSPRRTIYTS